MTNVLSWNRAELSYFNGLRKLDPKLPQAAADAVANEARARMRIIADRIQAGTISLQEGWAETKALSKVLAGAETALARGGFSEMRPSDWKRASGKALELLEGKGGKFPDGGARKVFEDASRGFFGPDLQQRGFSHWMQRPANQGHAIYENQRTEIHEESGFAFATRIRGAVDGCPTCLEEDDKTVPISEVVEIGNSECRESCRCTIIFSRE